MTSVVVHVYTCKGDCVHSAVASSTEGGRVAIAKEIAGHRGLGYESTLLQNSMPIRNVPEGMLDMKEHLFLKRRWDIPLRQLLMVGPGSEKCGSHILHVGTMSIVFR